MRLNPAQLLTVALLFAAADAGAMPSLTKGKGSNKSPIEVTSDSLEVLQQENRAVFSGRVVAIQGDVRLKADKMNVFYAKQDEKASSKKRPAKGDAAAGSIKKIEATGGVFMSTPEETASGNSGIYDVAHEQIFLNGDVVLTRGQNVLKGNKLTYNFATGKSVLTGGVATQAVPGKNGGSGRVRALFVPEENKGKK